MASKFELYGYGVFTTIAVVGDEPFRWESHWRRLTANAQAIAIDLSLYPKTSTYTTLLQALRAKNIVNGKARITFSDQRLSPLWMDTPPPCETALTIIAGEGRHVPDRFRLSISPYTVNSRSPLVGIKSCNYVENILTLDEAKGRGFDEAVRVNEKGEITSGAMANLFWLKDGVLVTPTLATGCLPGTTREFILENLDCHEVEAPIGELDAADAIFLTSAGLGVAEVAEFDGRKLRPSCHPIKSILPWAS
ncbi:MAG: aminotransferase class IV [Acidobacteriota bacterium]